MLFATKYAPISELSLTLFPPNAPPCPALPPSPPRGKRTDARHAVRPTSVRIHHTFFRVQQGKCSDWICAAIWKHGSNSDFLPVSLILQFCHNTLRSFSDFVSYFEEVFADCSDLSLDVYWLCFLIIRPNDWVREQPETWLPDREDLWLKFEGCSGVLCWPSNTVNWICNYTHKLQ